MTLEPVADEDYDEFPDDLHTRNFVWPPVDETTQAHGEHTMNADEHSGYSFEDFTDASWGRQVHLNNNL